MSATSTNIYTQMTDKQRWNIFLKQVKASLKASGYSKYKVNQAMEASDNYLHIAVRRDHTDVLSNTTPETATKQIIKGRVSLQMMFLI